jgi:hypothetical protein
MVGCLANALPFSCKPAAEPAPRFYANVAAAGLTVCNGMFGSATCAAATDRSPSHRVEPRVCERCWTKLDT